MSSYCTDKDTTSAPFNGRAADPRLPTRCERELPPLLEDGFISGVGMFGFKGWKQRRKYAISIKSNYFQLRLDYSALCFFNNWGNHLFHFTGCNTGTAVLAFCTNHHHNYLVSFMQFPFFPFQTFFCPSNMANYVTNVPQKYVRYNHAFVAEWNGIQLVISLIRLL